MEQIINLLHTGDYTIVIQKKERQYTSTKRGIAPILEVINTDVTLLEGATIADKVIGKAAALLLIYGKVKQIHADVISELAIEVLNQYHVSFTYVEKVPHIINRTKTDMCPMERCVLDIIEPNAAYLALKEAVAKMSK